MLILSLKKYKHLFRDILDNVESDIWVLWPSHFILQIYVCVCVYIYNHYMHGCSVVSDYLQPHGL